MINPMELQIVLAASPLRIEVRGVSGRELNNQRVLMEKWPEP